MISVSPKSNTKHWCRLPRQYLPISKELRRLPLLPDASVKRWTTRLEKLLSLVFGHWPILNLTLYYILLVIIVILKSHWQRAWHFFEIDRKTLVPSSQLISLLRVWNMAITPETFSVNKRFVDNWSRAYPRGHIPNFNLNIASHSVRKSMWIILS